MYQLENNVTWTTALKNAFKHGVTRGKIKYTNGNSEEVTIDENTGIKSIKIYDEKSVPNQGFIGQATSRQADINLLNTVNIHNLENKEIEVFLGADYNNQTYYINYGKFIVNQPPENDATNGTIKITAFDYMIKANIPYIPVQTFPCTLKQVVEDICTQTGLTFEQETFANYNFEVDSNQFDGKTCREVLNHVGKSAFSWVRIGQDNKLHIDFEVPDTITESIGVNDYYQDKFKKANEYYGAVNRVVYAESNIQGQEEKVEDTDDIALHGLHELTIYDNYFAYTTEKRHQLIQAGQRLFGLKYMPIQELQLVGLPYLECVDFIGITTPNNETYTTIPFNHIIEYNGAISDSLKVEAPSDTETTYKNTNSPINANSITEAIVDRAMREIRMIVGQYVNFLRTKTGNNHIFIDGTRDGEGFIPKFVVQGNTEYFENLITEYQRVEYIESTGSQYIDTGFQPSDFNDEIEIVASYHGDNTEQALFGVYSEETRFDMGTFGLTKTQNENEFRLDTMESLNGFSYILENASEKHTYNIKTKYLEKEYLSQMDFSIDNVIVNSSKSVEQEFSKDMYLFARNYNDEEVDNYGKWRIYGAKFYKDNKLVRDYIPCCRQSDGRAGLYDMVNNIFYTSPIGDNFQKGQNLPDITLIASEGIKNEETVITTEEGDVLITEGGDSIFAEANSLLLASKKICLTGILRNLVVDGVNYFDELQILSDGTIQIIRRIGVSESGILYLLDVEQTEVLEDTFVIPSREKGLYYFVKELNNLDYYAEYIIKNEYSDIYATEAYVKTGLDLKVDTKKLVSELNASADIIRIIGQRLIIQMQNYNLDENGFMKALIGEIAGFSFNQQGFSKKLDTLYSFSETDLQALVGYLNNYNSLSSGLQSLYNVTGNFDLDSADAIKMENIISGNEESPVSCVAEAYINSNNLNKLIEIKSNSTYNKTDIGIFSIYSYLLATNVLLLADATNSDVNGIIMDKSKRKITVKDGSSETIILPTGITTPTVTQTSKEADKKNITKLESALTEVINTDIYKYNLKTQEDDDKKHIGFIIGKDYNYSHLITTENDKKEEIGVEPYSMISVLWRAVQEQQEQIEQLQNEIKILKGEK